MYDAIVIGAGISGLTAAYQLFKSGITSLLVLEAGESVGGKIQTHHQEGFQYEGGPNTFPSTAKKLNALCRDLNLFPLPAESTAKNRYIYADDQLQPVPSGPVSFLTTRLLSLGGKLSLLAEPFKAAPPLGVEESVGTWTRRRLGPQALERLVGPLLTGIYAGDPEQLSVQAIFPKIAQWEAEAGSVLKGAIRARKQAKKEKKTPKTPYQLLSFSQGLGALPQALAQALPTGSIRCNAPVTRLEKTAEGYRVFLPSGETVETRTLVLAVPAGSAAHLVAPLASDAGHALSQIPYANLDVVHLGFESATFPHKLDGFGFLVSLDNVMPFLGSIWASSLFRGRAPQGQALMSCFIGGARHPETTKLSDSQLISEAVRHCGDIFGTRAVQPVFQQACRYTEAIPQYTMGHLDRVGLAQTALNALPGIAIAGNYLHGIALESCVESAQVAADNVSQFLRQRSALQAV